MHSLLSDLVDIVREHESFKPSIKRFPLSKTAMKSIEEMSELIQMIAKLELNSTPEFQNNFCEEFADTIIVLTRLFEQLDTIEKANIEFHLGGKLERLRKLTSSN